MAMAAATSRLLLQTSSALLRRRSSSSSSFPLRRFSFLSTPSSSLFPLRSHQRLVFLSTSSAIATDEGSATESIYKVSDSLEDTYVHPWPEWEGFLEKLKGKGYFNKSSSSPSAVDEGVEGGEGGDKGVSLTSPSFYSRVKMACLGFARERPDLLRSLPKEDIKAIVECGCPNLLRKSVNSAKRLRAYLKLDEGDVCSSCNLRGSCDRAYVMAKQDEGARTVDIVRILLQYAAEPATVGSVEKPKVKECVEESVRKLLSELIKLSETTPDPDLLKAMLKPQKKEELPQITKVWETKQHQNAEMKRGDWICSQCNFMNYARNLRCLKCKGDGPKRVSFDSGEMKKGDWTCPKCQYMNFARNSTCRHCHESRPKKDLEPGEWECPKCNFLNFRRNRACPKCSCDRPEEESNQYEDGVWRKPKLSAEAAELL